MLNFFRFRLSFLWLIAAWALTSHCIAALTFETQEIQQIVSSDDKKTSALFHFKNFGQNPVVIRSLQPGCSCTTAALTKEIYLPGETGEISAVFNFKGRVGRQEEIIQVTTDEESNNLIVLTLKVEITEPLKCSSRLLLWRVGEQVGDKEVVITPLFTRKIRTISVEPASPADVVVRVEPLGSEGGYRLIIHPASTTKVINAAIACIATFTDGTEYPFKVFALMR